MRSKRVRAHNEGMNARACENDRWQMSPCGRHFKLIKNSNLDVPHLLVFLRGRLHHNICDFMNDWFRVGGGRGDFDIILCSFCWVGETGKRFIDILEVQ